MQISIIIPVYNEEKSVEKVINDIKSAMKTTAYQFEIIAINDCSTDNSAMILNKMEDIVLIHRHVNKGYGASLKTGIKRSQYDHALIIDADGTYPAAEIPNFIESAKKYDLVTGDRNKKNCAIPLERKHAKAFLNKFASYLSGKKIPDLNCGLRIFKKEIVFRYWELFPERFSFTSTLTMLCATRGYDIKFISIDYYKRKGKSSIRPSHFFNFLKLIFKLSLFFNPIKVFIPVSMFILLGAILLPILFFAGIADKFYDVSFIVLVATSLQTFFFGLLAEIVIHNK
ncbi:MAG: glycosyltransferase family 2 protein [Patescibacteria group bacterium]|nr:glycosyltransferase family 2 protein [Patescibacteria group bacterium]